MIDEKARQGKALLQKLNLSNDFLFMHVMKDEEICKIVIEEILNIKIKKIVYAQNQFSIKEMYEDKGVRFDVYVNDDKGTIYNIEMQAKNTDDIPKRSRYYQSSIDVNSLQSGGIYRDLKDSFVVFICCFDIFGKDNYKYTFKNRCEEYPDLSLNDGTVKIFLNTRGTKGNISRTLKDFLKYTENSTDELAANSSSELVKRVHERVKTIKKSNEMGRDYMTMIMRDRENYYNGIEEGRVQGREEGRVQGREEGRVQGKVESIFQIAKKMLLSDVPIDFILNMTGISEDELNKIKTEIALC